MASLKQQQHFHHHHHSPRTPLTLPLAIPYATHPLHPTPPHPDDKDGVIVSKRDPESAHPVRVASMDYFVPEKVPQPKNVLESLVWDREKEVDRARERFQVPVLS